ncbi:MAG: hypothetical protein ACRCWC_04230 [Plesiomonas shigelloides]
MAEPATTFSLAAAVGALTAAVFGVDVPPVATAFVGALIAQTRADSMGVWRALGGVSLGTTAGTVLGVGGAYWLGVLEHMVAVNALTLLGGFGCLPILDAALAKARQKIEGA